MLELQCDLRSLLRYAAFFKGIGKLVGFANTHQELRLCEKFVRLHSMVFCGRRHGTEVHVGSDVLFAWRFIRISTN